MFFNGLKSLFKNRIQFKWVILAEILLGRKKPSRDNCQRIKGPSQWDALPRKQGGV